MQITTEELFAEASTMALELRLKDKAIGQQEQTIRQLQARIAELEKPAEPGEPA
jgi:hypothetical protein